MDLKTSPLVSKVSSPSLLKLQIKSPQQDLTNGTAFEGNSAFKKENILTSDFLINSTNVSSFSDIDVVEISKSAHSKRFRGSPEYVGCGNFDPIYNNHLETNGQNRESIHNGYGSHVYENKQPGASETVTTASSKYQNLVSSSSIGETDSIEFINPESILETNQDKNDFDNFEDYLQISEDIEPHFIVGSYTDSKLINSADENQIDSTVNMGIENSWNEDFAVPSTSNFPLPLPLPAPPESSSFSDFPTCNNFEGTEDESYNDLEAFFNCNESEVDAIESTAESGVCGLRNLGNTCFMSAGIQCLAATEPLVQFFVYNASSQQIDEHSLTVQFSDLLQRMWTGRYSVVNPAKFKQALGIYHSQFKDSGQHDCQEFLALLLDALHQQLITPKEVVEPDSFGFNEKMDTNVDLQQTLDELSNGTNNDVTDNNIASPPKLLPIVNNIEDWDGSNNNSRCIESKRTKVNKTFNDEADSSTNNNNNEAVPVESSISTAIFKYRTGSVSPRSCNELEVSTTNSDDTSSYIISSSSTALNSGCVSTNKIDCMKDIFKEAKTSNVNVSVSEVEANNGICFDSEKFPKKERRRNIADSNYCDGLTMRNKISAWLKEDPNVEDNLDLKRIKVNHLHKENVNYLVDKNRFEKNALMEKERHMKILNIDVKTNKDVQVMETEENVVPAELIEEEMPTLEEVFSKTDNEELLSIDDLEAEKHWERHVMDNRSVVFNSFQGQFKNTVVCSACNFKSVTYEPFMYLSVPLPHAIEKQICVTFVSACAKPPVKYLITLTKQDEVQKIKHHLLKLIPEELNHPLVVGEVLDYHIAKILDDNYQVRYVDDVNRSIYVFEQLHVAAKNIEVDYPMSSSRDNGNENDIPESVKSETCSICLEEKESDIKKHRDCDCVLCEICIQSYAQHSGDMLFKCPVCRNDVIPAEDLIPIEQADMKPNTRFLNVPVVYRVDQTGDGNNNRKSVKLFGHPALLKLPNQISSKALYEIVAEINPYQPVFELLFVDGQGRHCSRCLFNQHCKGCAIPRDSPIILRSDDTIAVTFNKDVEQVNEKQHPSMSLQRSQDTLSLYDCVQAFSQSEILDEYNPWYCPECKKNQCATKTLSVWRFPNYLIVYLKRFVFHECTSIKLEDKVAFPLHDFSFNKKNGSSYDLYACVCHTGGVSVGHYVAYTQHPLTNEWHCYNDENVSKQKPQEEEYSNAYILFYKKKE